MKKVLIFLLLFLSLPSFSKIDEDLKKSYIELINSSSDLHQAVIEEKPEEFQEKIKDLQGLTARVIRKLSASSAIHHQIHAHKVLQAIEEQVVILQTGDQKESLSKRKNMKKLFHSFSELALAYDLKKEVKPKMFFCSRDKSMWFQKEGPTKNPVTQSLRNCGRRI